MNLTRREFVKGGLASLGFLALPGGLFAAPPGWKPKGKKPNLVFGAVSDTHVRTAYDGVSRYWRFSLKYFRGALEWFKASNADAVVHGGDFAHRGMAASMRFHAEEWREVFGKSGGPVKLFVSGNHDIGGEVEHGEAARRERRHRNVGVRCARRQSGAGRDSAHCEGEA
ncbi:MAG: metallophosphoesterase [Kiritimatiellae bacterium]|nr:metallophosphoesterase [Kiritimatiellia bacterium]